MAGSSSSPESNRAASREQQHPQYATDRDLLNQLLEQAQAQPRSDWVLAEVARLRIRYQGFPGARDLQRDLDQILQQWGMSEEELFVQTRAIHERGQVYDRSFSKRDDWA
ncbi:DUF3288 family protein [Thermostichus vulcanus]|uniref:DUF3288 family protein n=1 Tax=Thermostichus vulcanus str. 'Rupite' TaxID=2813851 RepID=A0ABT0C6W2_THEVL|nr:DUF3288 family protein [Thermostichus vulcanus]MCJ2541539.1 DUF3288 family protein [Thermostichus vulcanus str. 'Rupite']